MAEITNPVAAAALRTYQQRNGEIRKAIEGIGDTGINWMPAKDTNSIFAVLWHALDVQRSSISNAAGTPAAVDRRDLDKKGTEAELLARLDESDAELERYLSAITDLAAERQAMNRTVTAAQVLLNGISHVTEHLAHASLTRQLWDQYGTNGVLKGVER